MKKIAKKIVRLFSSIVIKQNDPELIKKIKTKFTHNERSFVYGGIKYLVDSLYCHASPGVLATVALELENLKKNKKISGNKLLNVGGGQVSAIYESIGYDVYNLDIGIKPDIKNILFN